jgi:DNA-binding transcriptional ArsR family regulator
MTAGSKAKNMVTALADPLRRQILEQLTLEAASAAELATDLAAPVEQVRYQIKRLRALGLVTVQSERHRRGAVERTFITDCSELIFRRDEVAGIPERRLRDLGAETWRSLFRDAVEAARTGTLHNDDRHHVVRLSLPLDAQGFREVGERFEVAVDRLVEVRKGCLVRLEESGEKPRPGITGLLFFEKPD